MALIRPVPVVNNKRVLSHSFNHSFFFPMQQMHLPENETPDDGIIGRTMVLLKSHTLGGEINENTLYQELEAASKDGQYQHCIVIVSRNPILLVGNMAVVTPEKLQEINDIPGPDINKEPILKMFQAYLVDKLEPLNQ